MKYHVPWPIESVTIVDVQNIRRAEIGFRTRGGAEAQRVLEEALMLTQDENIVEVGLLIQYRISDAAEYVFRVQNPEAMLQNVSEVALRSAVGQMPIDGIITERRADVQQNTRALMQSMLERYGGGMLITDVFLQVADAPEQVRDAFQDVVRAREDRERTVNEAQAYREDILPKARGEAQRIVQGATAYREERVRQARGETERFLAVLREYRAAPAVTRERMHIEALERALAKVDKVLIGAGVQDGILPFLPLRGARGAQERQATRGGDTPPATTAPPQPAASTAPTAPPAASAPAPRPAAPAGGGR
ncbi:MAG: FtsH protease activity modulator HflK [Chloroflexi bacterium]|nr:FtsH protease activity modulator HflK [Chloroflexota bacterium]